MKPYPEYKETGLSWLPKIPKHWELVRAKNLYRRVVRAVRPNDDVVTCFRDGVVTLRKNRRTTGFTESLQEIGYQGIRKGDLVIHAMDAFAGAVGVSDSDGKGTPVYSVCVAKEGFSVNNYFYAYVVREMAKTGFIQSLYRGIRERSSDFRFEVFGNQELPLPPVKEQEKIVRYLDLMTAKIDKLIDAKKKQIALLQEKKQTIVNQVVTRGLNPDVQLKDSGVDWLDKIPVHWEVNKVGHMFSSVLGKMLASSPTSESDTLENYICAKDVHFSGIDISDLKQMWFSREEKLLYSVKQGDLLIVEGGAGAGGTFVYREEKKCYIQNSIHLVRPRSKCFSVDFLYYWMYALIGKNYIPYACNKATIPHFTKDKLFETPFPVVPEEEQKVIVFYLEKEFRKIDNASSIFEKEISLYQEYKASLISDIVLGRICS